MSNPLHDHMTEAQLQTKVITLAMHRGWRVHHGRPARTATGWATAMQGHVGFPDLILARAGHIIAVELKREGEDPTADQLTWLVELGFAEYREDRTVAVWRPSDWPAIEATLT